MPSLRSVSPSPKPHPPHRPLHRSPSEPAGLGETTHDASCHQQIYVLSADGSSLFLLDPSKPSGNEEPPPYAPFRADVELPPRETVELDAGPSSPTSALSPVPFPAIVIPDPQPRHRASTLQEGSTRRNLEGRPRVRNNHSFSHVPAAAGGRRTRDRRSHSTRSSPGTMPRNLADERTPLLQRELGGEEWTEIAWLKRRGLWKAIFCGEIEEGDAGRTWGDGWRRFWRPVRQARYWKPLVHLWLLNFPFALFVWPPLVAGTLAGTALLITLPIGAAVWWLTLFIARSAARLETIMQLTHHSPLRPSISQPTYHPIFYRIKERAPVSNPGSPVSETPPDVNIVWEKRFITCSYAMFCDHYSYSALSYFLLIKPLIVLFSTIVLWALFPVAAVLIFTLPMYLRAARRWGQWQAGVAIDNL